MRQIALAALLALPMPAAAASWLCVSEAATGFTLQGGEEYVAAPYKAGRNYLIRPARREDVQNLDNPDQYTFVAEILGDRTVAYFTEDIRETGELYSNIAGSMVFHFSPREQRFSMSMIYPYLLDREAEQYPPFMEIGRCSKID